MADGGYIKLFRGLARHELWHREPFTIGQAWVDLLMLANYHDSTVVRGRQQLTVRRGQVFTSVRGLQKRWKRDRKTVRGWLAIFALDCMVDLETDKGVDGGYTLVTVQNYDRYQGIPGGDPGPR